MCIYLVLRRSNSSNDFERLPSVRDDVCEWPTKVCNLRLILIEHLEAMLCDGDHRLELLTDFVGTRECCFAFVGCVRRLGQLRLSSREYLFRGVMFDCQPCDPRCDLSQICFVARRCARLEDNCSRRGGWNHRYQGRRGRRRWQRRSDWRRRRARRHHECENRASPAHHGRSLAVRFSHTLTDDRR